MKIILNPITQRIVDAIEREEFSKLPPINVLMCGGCGADKFMIFENGEVACGNCHERVAGVDMAINNVRT